MTDIIGTNGKEIKSQKKSVQDESLLLLEKVHKDIKELEPKEFDSITVLLKIKGKNLKYSLGIADAILDVGQLEAIKYDILKKMHS